MDELEGRSVMDTSPTKRLRRAEEDGERRGGGEPGEAEERKTVDVVGDRHIALIKINK